MSPRGLSVSASRLSICTQVTSGAPDVHVSRARREFYYIQIEKCARQKLEQGVRDAGGAELHVGGDWELYRALALHYNRNQQLRIPDQFRAVVEQTLREFFRAVLAARDVEPSWKKPIYKVIARLDQPVPELFKAPNWLALLERASRGAAAAASASASGDHL